MVWSSPTLGSAVDVWLTESADGYSLNIEQKQDPLKLVILLVIWILVLIILALRQMG